jgi:1-acyl-sn-glycerol-3-phosphate acyltransferase
MTTDQQPRDEAGNQFQLLGTRRFLPFFLTQFLGALNDNLFKNAMVLLLTFKAAQSTGLDSGVLVNLAGGVFILPFFLFSATAGQLADKYERSRIIRLVKILEICIAAVGTVGFVTHHVALLFAALFLLGVHSTMFGPVKYAILPQHLRETELVGGNALVESGTFVAILFGTIIAGVLMARPDGATQLIPATTVTVALAGYLTSRGVPRAPAPDPGLRVEWNPIPVTWRTIVYARGNLVVFRSVLGISWYWFLGAMMLAQFPEYAKVHLGGQETMVTLLLAVFAVGVGLGSLLCEKMSGHKVEIGLVPFGAIGLTLFIVDLWLASPAAGALGEQSVTSLISVPGTWRIIFDLIMIGAFGGFYIVPLYALVQVRSDPAHLSRVIASNNILNALFMVVAALAGAAFIKAGGTIPQLFLVAAILNALVAIYIFLLVPEFLMRFLAWLLIHSIYRLRRIGIENIPEKGPALLTCNHVSFVDAVVILAASPRPIRFVMDHNIFRVPVLSFVFRTGKAIPIASQKENPAMLEAAYAEVSRALKEGDLVAIFPEGRITHTGEIGQFKRGIERILEKDPVPVIPMALCNLFGSMFSRKDGPAFFKAPRKLFARIELRVGKALTAGGLTSDEVREHVVGLHEGRS